MKGRRWLLAVTIGLVAYAALFFATRLPSLEPIGRGPFRRVTYFWLLLLPDDLLRSWIGQPGETGVLDRLPVIGLAGLILVFGWATGRVLLRVLGAGVGLTRLECFTFATAFGLNVISSYTLLVGLAGLLRWRSVFLLPAVAIAAACCWICRPSFPAARAGPAGGHRGSDWPVPLSKGHVPEVVRPLWLWAALPFVLIVFFGGMLPPVDFDVREYHLQVPKEFFLQGRIAFLPHNVYGNMAMGVEMHSLLAMVMAGDWWLGALAGKTVVAMFAPLTALALFGAGRRWLGTAAGTVAAVAYVSVPWIVHVSESGLVEGAVSCYLFLAVYAVLLWMECSRVAGPGDNRAGRRGMPGVARLVLAGYMAGSAVATKYPAALFVLVPLVVVVAAWKWRYAADCSTGGAGRRIGQRACRAGAAMACFLAAAVVACGLWFGKNWLLTGNPTYPLLYEVFGGKNWTAEKNEKWNRAHRPRWPEDFSPSRLAADMARVAWRSEWLSPLVMPLAVLAVLALRGGVPDPKATHDGAVKATQHGVSRATVFWLCSGHFVFVIVTWWLFTHRIDRFWIPALPLLCLLAGIGACWNGQRTWRITLVCFLAVGLLFDFLVSASARPGVYNRYFVRLDRLRVHPERVDPWLLYFNQHCRKGRVLLVGAAEVFDLEVPVLYNTVFDDCLFERLVKGRSAAAIRASFVQLGLTHVFVHWGEIARYRSPGNYGFSPFVQPEVFQRLVAEGILRPLPPLDHHPGRAYVVVADGEQPR